MRKELEGRRSDRKHDGSWSLDFPPELVAAMTAAYTSLLQTENQTQLACMPLSLSMEWEVSKEKERKPKTLKKEESRGQLDSKRGKEEIQKREGEQATETCIELVKFIRYEPDHSSTCSWGLGTEKGEEKP